jgi:predicted  nucleic acid-binding Zn-ribbon protein
MKEPKQKNCIECGKLFNQYNSLVKVCSTDCAIKNAKAKTKKEVSKQWQKEKKEIKEKLMTKSDLEKLLQKEINTIVRLIDKGFVCISTQKPLNEKFDAGHFYSVGSNPTLRFNLLNIYAQSVYANQYLSGDQINFINGIKENYGSGLKSIVLRLKQDYPIIKLTQDELKEKTLIARSIVKHLKIENKTYNSVERIELRKKFNKMIGIYV